MLCPICNSYNPPGAARCSACGAPLEDTVPSPSDDALPPGTKLQGGNYTLGKVLGQGGFGITYLGSSVPTRSTVAIKEFYPTGSTRQGKMVRHPSAMTPEDYREARGKFIEEARILSQFKHPGIVRVYSYFEENNTAYMVMEYLKGRTLQNIVEEKGAVPERDAVAWIRAAGQALAIVHSAGLLHRDIKPDNIVLTDDGRVVLLDFGSARGFAAGKTRRMTALLTPGYAPLEQYAEMAQRGPYTDIYALAATLYHLLTGQMPVQATDRAAGVELKSPKELNPRVSKPISDAVMWAMETKVDDRPQSVPEFLQALRLPSFTQRQRQRHEVQQPRPQPRPSQPRRFPAPPPQPQVPTWPDFRTFTPKPGSLIFDHCLSAFIGMVAGGIGGSYLGSMGGFIAGSMLGFIVGLILGRSLVYMLITGIMGTIGYYAATPIARYFNFTNPYTTAIGIGGGILLGVILSLILDRNWRG